MTIGVNMKTEGAPAAQAVDLVAVALHRAGLDPRCNLLVRIAAETLAGIPAAMVDEVAEFAFAEVCRQAAREDERARVIKSKHDMAIERPEEHARRRKALKGGPYQSPTASQHFNMHRSGTLLATGLAGLRKKDRPASAKDSQLFAALGVLLMVYGLECVYNAKRETLRLDAAECIRAWKHLKDEVRHREPWIQDLLATDPTEFIIGNGRVMSAKRAFAHFHFLYPAHLHSVDKPRTFGNEYTAVRQALTAFAKNR